MYHSLPALSLETITTHSLSSTIVAFALVYNQVWLLPILFDFRPQVKKYQHVRHIINLLLDIYKPLVTFAV